MITGNKFEISTAVDPSHFKVIDKDGYVKAKMCYELAESIVDHTPIEVNIENRCGPMGDALEVHKMRGFIFSEKELEEHDAYIRKTVMYSMAADRCLNTLPKEVTCH